MAVGCDHAPTAITSLDDLHLCVCLQGYPASLPCAVPINLPPAVQAQLLSLAQLGALLQQLPQQHPPLPNQQLRAAQAGGAHNVTPMEEAPLLEGISAKYPSYVTQASQAGESMCVCVVLTPPSTRTALLLLCYCCCR